MNMALNIFEQFDKNVSLVSKIMESADTGVEDIEPYLVEILQIIKDNPDQKKQFINKFINFLKMGSAVPLEIFWYCMHDLKWSEVYEAVEHYKNSSSDLRLKRAAELILDAFSDDWEDAMMFERYRS